MLIFSVSYRGKTLGLRWSINLDTEAYVPILISATSFRQGERGLFFFWLNTHPGERPAVKSALVPFHLSKNQELTWATIKGLPLGR